MKKRIRQEFRQKVFERDDHTCVMCGDPAVDAHHITDRHEGGKNSLDNGISLCSKCHEKAEMFHRTGTSHPGYSPRELRKKVAYMRIECWKMTSDSWSPSYRLETDHASDMMVRVTHVTNVGENKLSLVNVWGADDTGMEKWFNKGREQDSLELFLQILEMTSVTMRELKDMGLEMA
jgi:ribosomal protein S27AE